MSETKFDLSKIPGFKNEETPTDPPQEKQVGRKDDKGKIRWSLIPWDGLRHALLVLEHGAVKYGELNWQYVSNSRERYKEALGRHVVSFLSGEIYDKDTGLPELAHIVVNGLFLLHFHNEDTKK